MRRSKQRFQQQTKAKAPRKARDGAGSSTTHRRLALLSALASYRAALQQLDAADWSEYEVYQLAKATLRSAEESAGQAIRAWHGLRGTTHTPPCAVQADGILYVAVEVETYDGPELQVIATELADAPVISGKGIKAIA